MADPGCLSRTPDPGSWFLPIPDPGSRIPDPKTATKEREGWKKICCHNFLCSDKFHKIANYFSFEVLKKKIWANFQRIIELLTQKIVNKLSKIWVWDPGSEIRDPGKTYSGSRIQGSKKHRIPDPDPGGLKWTSKKEKKFINFIVWSAWCSLLRAESFSCSLDVLYGGLEISKLQFLIKKISFSAVFF